MAPQIAWLTANRRCNMRCPWCYAQGSHFSPEFDMSFDMAISLVESAAFAGVRSIVLIGGEPTLWPHLLEINRLIRSKGMSSTLATNAIRFGNDGFWEQYQRSQNDRIGVSIKVWDEDSARRIVGVSDFKTLVRGIERGIKAAGGTASFVVTEACIDHLVEMAKFSYTCGARYLSISIGEAFIVDGKPSMEGLPTFEKLSSNLPLYFDEIERMFSGCVSISLKTPLCAWPRDFIVRILEKKQIRTGCHVQKRSGIVFNHDGSLAICNSLTDYPIGQFGADVFDGQTMLQLVSSKPVSDAYDRINSYPSEKCSQCEMWSSCGGGCPVSWTALNPDGIIVGWQQAQGDDNGAHLRTF